MSLRRLCHKLVTSSRQHRPCYLGSQQTTHFVSKQSFSTKVPQHPTWEQVNVKSLPKIPEINLPLVEQLERISLVELNNETGLQQLQDAVKSANQLHQLNTEGVEPFDSVLEERELWLRGDEVTEGNCTEQILSNATKTEEQYFISPPGNIPLKKKDKQHLQEFLSKKINKNS